VEEPQFVLNATTLAAIGGIMGVLTGAISFLTKSLLESKDKQIEDLKQINLHNEETLVRDRDYWRDYVIHHDIGDKQTGAEPVSQDRP
jgi:hypothetical protein